MAKQQICGVYRITNTVNGKIYVGSSKDIYNRWEEHRYALNHNNHGNIHLQRAWNKYGQNNFKFDIIETCDPLVQFEREQFYLNTLNPFDDNGYNIVRRISREYMSDNYIVKKCVICGKNYNTFSHLSKYCDDCKRELKEEETRRWKTWIPDNITSNDILSWGYDGWDDFWESVI